MIHLLLNPTVLFVIVTIVAVAVTALLFGKQAAITVLKDMLANEQAITSDLHNRLASKSLAEYQAVTQPAPPPPAQVEHISDPTGLISVPVESSGPAA